MSKKMHELKHQINRPKSIKEATKTLIVTTHYANLRTIDRFKPRSKAKKFPTSIDQTDAGGLLEALQAYDKENELVLNSRLSLRTAPYVTVSKSYGLLVKSVKKLEHVVRTIIHKARNQ